LDVDEVEIVASPLVLASPADVDALEAALWVTLPVGYREYMTRLGEGILGSLFVFVRVYPPWRVEKELADWRRRIGRHWVWDAGREVLPRGRAVECVIVGDTLNGDQLVFHPGRPGHLFVLPRRSGRVFDAGPDLLAAVEWMCGSGELCEPFPERRFNPFDTRTEPGGGSATPGRVPDPEGESLDDIMELGRRWAERHAARDKFQSELRRHAGEDRTSAPVYEGIILEGSFLCRRGYAVEHSIIDKPSGLEVGVFRGWLTSNSIGSSYKPNRTNLTKLREQGGM
jgi:hypothetical protein